MTKLLPLMALISAVAWSAAAAGLDAPAEPASPDSAVFTLNDLYHNLDLRTPAVKRTGPFSEPASGPASTTSKTLNDIMTLATNRAAVRVTGQKSSYASHDDADYRASFGVVYPAARFSIGTNTTGQANDTNCVTDNVTGLMWARNANLFGEAAWASQLENCASLEYGGYSDWRLPTICELQSLVDFGYANPAFCSTDGTGIATTGNPFHNLAGGRLYWTSTTVSSSAGQSAFIMASTSGRNGTRLKSVLCFGWPVRGGGK